MQRFVIALIMIVSVPLPGVVAAISDDHGGPGQVREVAAATSGARGRVVTADSATAVQGAQVRLLEITTHVSKTAFTDASGRYEIGGLPAGRYNATVTKLGMLTGRFGQASVGEPGKTVTLGVAQIVGSIDFRMWRPAVITGHVYNEIGEPASGVDVTAMQAVFRDGERRLMPLRGASKTTDTGEFRLFDLPPGAYYLLATVPSRPTASDNGKQKGYAPTYFPGTDRAEDATSITVKASEVSNATVGLCPVLLGGINGRIAASDVAPSRTVHVGDDHTARSWIVSVRSDGGFVIRGLPPGTYLLRTDNMQPPPMVPLVYAGQATVGRDGMLADVVLTAVSMSTARGRLVVASSAASTLRAAVHVGANPVGGAAPLGGSPSSAVKEDLTFEFHSWPGLARVGVQIDKSGWIVKAVRFRGVDVTDTGILFASGEDINGIEIELSDHPEQVFGSVTNDRGEPVRDYSVVLFSQDPRRWSLGRYVAVGQPDQDGRFLVRSLPPGDYYAVAVTSTAGAAAADPEALERFRSDAIKFTIGEGETRALKLDMKRQ